METILFANPQEGFSLENDKIKEEVVKLCTEFKNIEDINCSSEGAPSKRLQRIYASQKKKYSKVTDAVDIMELSGIESVLEKCPRFKNWLEILIEALIKSQCTS